MARHATAALARLLQAITIDDHEEILNAANVALKEFPGDLHVQRTKAVALLKLDRFDDLLRVIDGAGDKLREACVAERAYALYKIGRLDEARECLRSVGSEHSKAVSHLGAQVAYRAERFGDARNIYQRLVSLTSNGSPEERELMINKTATGAQLVWCGQGGVENSTVVDDLDTFELAYNAACACIARGALSEASLLLDQAIRLCNNSDLSDAEKQVEMLPILAQQGYVYSRRGMSARASDTYAIIGDSVDGDAEAMMLKKLNASLLVTEDTNSFAARRGVDEALAAGGKVSLFSHQASKVEQLKLVLDMRAQKFAGAEARTGKAGAEHSPLPLSVINAAARARGASGKAAMAACQNLSKERPLDLGLVLCTVQLSTREKSTGTAVSAVESFLRRLEAEKDSSKYGPVRFSPGLVALVVSLYRMQGRQQSARAELAKAADYYAKQTGCPSLSLLREAGLELIKSHNQEDTRLASDAFKAVLKSIPEDPVATAGYVASSSMRQDDAVEEYLKRVPAAQDLVSGLNIGTLLEDGVVSSLSAASQTKRKAPSQMEAPVKKKRRRRLPKNMEEGKQPDPERWLPLRDRSSYRPKGKKGKKKANEATQGGIVKDEETLELVGGAGAVKVEKAANTPSSKKKKKGRK